MPALSESNAAAIEAAIEAADSPPLLTVDDVAADLRLSTRTVYELLRTGGLPGFRLGNRWRVEPAELAKWKRARARRMARIAREGF